MNASRRTVLARRRGFTIVELAISLVIFTSVGYGLAVVVGVGKESQTIVESIHSASASQRTARELIADDLRTANDTSITITSLADYNSQVRLQQPITVGGADTWGVYDRTLGSTEAEQNRAGWRVQYTVRSAEGIDGNSQRELVRQLLDGNGAVQKTEVLAQYLNSGGETPPGFRVVQSGAMWVVTITSSGDPTTKAGMRTTFHVQTRN